MTRSLIGKFAMVFWLLYFVVIIPIFVFIQLNVSSILDDNEKSKIELVTKTLKPVISTYLAFDQQEMLSDTVNTFFENPNILRVSLVDTNEKPFLEQSRSGFIAESSITISEPLRDPITNKKIATLIISYSNSYLHELQMKLLTRIVFLSFFALLIFFITFIYFRNQFLILGHLSDWMGRYNPDQNSEPFGYNPSNTEISTIITSANTMRSTIEKYKHEMEKITIELEQRVESEIEQRRQKEQILIHQSRLAAMGEMIESIAHQWRQPLNIIGLAVSNIEMKRELGLLDDAEVIKNSDIINSNLGFMSNTIDDFRNFFNLNKESAAFEPIQPINEIFHILNEQLLRAQITYTVHEECNPKINGVVNEFKQVILNIINNAKDAIVTKNGPAGGVIDVFLRCDPKYLYVLITDNGGGISPAIVKRIFEPYFTTKFQKQGTGIGLYMSKVIVEQHFEGFINVDNTSEGARFTISIPLVRT